MNNPRRPNVIMIVLDDTGFAELGCYGSAIATPNFDRIAQNGIRFNNFHTTAWCAPTRACLLTGRNHHSVGMGFFPHVELEHAGYTGRIPKSAGTLARVLRDSGYNAYAVGKWHLTPRDEHNPTGPFDHWPLGMGFERYYGFLGGFADHWSPNLVCDNGFIENSPSVSEPYHLTEDLTSRAVQFIADHHHTAPDKPFFLYFAPGATHWPQHVPRKWIEPYIGKFDGGWELLRESVFLRQKECGVIPPDAVSTARPPWVTPWNELSPDERRVFARQMEVYAGFLSHTDASVGRISDYLRTVGLLDDTLIVVLSDNGAAGDEGPDGAFNVINKSRTNEISSTIARLDDLGGDRSFGHYSWGWAWAGNTPFRLWKHYAWLGGVRVPLVMHWPNGIRPGENGKVRDTFCHAIDLMPTVLEACHAKAPEFIDGIRQQPLDGRSFLRSLDEDPMRRPHRSQYFEAMGSRAIYQDGWMAVTNHIGKFPHDRKLISGSHDFDEDTWSLFHMDEDFSQARDIAANHTDRLQRMIQLWWDEALHNQVLPLMDDTADRAAALDKLRDATPLVRTYGPVGGPIMTPSLVSGFVLTAEIEVASTTPVEGVLCAQGDWHLGWACYFLNGRFTAVFNLGDSPDRISIATPINSGRHQLIVSFATPAEGSALASVTIDGREIGRREITGALRLPFPVSCSGPLLIGRDIGLPVCADYQPPFHFTERISKVTLRVPNPDCSQGVIGGSRREPGSGLRD